MPRGVRRIVGDKRHTRAARATFAPDNLQMVRMIAMRGSTDEELAAICGVSTEVWRAWRKLYPSFNEAIEKGRTRADAEVLVSLYQRATGYDFAEEQAVGGRDPCVLTVRRHAPPSVEAIKFWQTNRQREHWRNRDSIEHSGEGGGPLGIKVESRSELIDAIMQLVANKPDGETKPGKQA